MRWGADVILTDVTKRWLDLRVALRGIAHDVFSLVGVLMSRLFLADYDTTLAQHSRWFLWTTWKFYLPGVMVHRSCSKYALEKIAGSFDRFSLPEPIAIEGVPV